MRKIMWAALAAATIVPTLASAQDAELRHDRRDVAKQERQLGHAEATGSRHDVREQRHDVREARQEYRSDWRDYRRDHPGWYHRPAYVGPRGYAYRPVTIGYRFAPAYYGQEYRIADWQRYRLPPPSPYANYIRYGNDVALVDLRTGAVIQIYNGFFL